MKKEQFYLIGGRHAVIESVNNPKRTIKTIYVNSEKNLSIIESVNKKKAEVLLKSKEQFDKLFKDKSFSHQGFAAEIHALNYQELDDFLKDSITNKQERIFVILDNVQDDRNIGSIIRSSYALGACGLIVNKREFRKASMNMHKAASGAIEYLPVFQVSNILNSIHLLKKNSYWIYSMDSNSKDSIFLEKFGNNLAFIFGSEFEGIKNIVLKNSDKKLKIPMKSNIGSLNISNAVAATLAIVQK
tara:strand:+ start:88 stop:819 length:732 start_codon:yes stop_codon:yes gene_type:complete